MPAAGQWGGRRGGRVREGGRQGMQEAGGVPAAGHGNSRARRKCGRDAGLRGGRDRGIAREESRQAGQLSRQPSRQVGQPAHRVYDTGIGVRRMRSQAPTMSTRSLRLLSARRRCLVEMAVRSRTSVTICAERGQGGGKWRWSGEAMSLVYKGGARTGCHAWKRLGA